MKKHPSEQKPPKDMVEAAKRFIQHYVDFDADDETIDEQLDVALFEWKAWVGSAYNEALEQLGLITSASVLDEFIGYNMTKQTKLRPKGSTKMKVTKYQLKEMIREVIREQLDDDIGAWYSRKEEKRKKAWEKLQKAKEKGNPEEIKKAKKEYEQAAYVGD